MKTQEYTIYSESKKSYFKIMPAIGGLVTELNIQGRDVIYFDRDILNNSMTENDFDICAGGIPILFPVAGAVRFSKYTVKDKEYTMMPHGFARVMPWEVFEMGENSISIRLTSNEKTMEIYPFSFEVIYKYIIDDESMTIEQQYINKGEDEMFFSAGIHPFYIAEDKDNIKFNIPASNVLDYNQHKNLPVRENIVFYRVIDYVYDMNEGNYGMKNDKLGYSLEFEVSEKYKTMVMWSPLGKNIICMEPWTSKPYSLNEKKDLCYVKAGETFESKIKFYINRK